MKRRSFLQWCLGVLGVGAASVPAVKASPEFTPPNYTEFPGAITGISKIEGKYFIFCEHSIWEIGLDSYEEIIQTRRVNPRDINTSCRQCKEYKVKCWSNPFNLRFGVSVDLTKCRLYKK